MNLNFSCYIEYRFYLVSERFITLYSASPDNGKTWEINIYQEISSAPKACKPRRHC